MTIPRPSMPRPFHLGPIGRAIVMLVTTLALAVVVSLIWISVANPRAEPMRLLGEGAIGASAGIRRITAALLVLACALAGVTGIILLAIDFRAGARWPAGAAKRQSPGKRIRRRA